MRTYGRVWTTPTNTNNSRAVPQWVEIQTDPFGNNDWVYITTLAQVLRLSLNESPFYANYGIPAQQAVVQQVFPDYYVALTQQTFAQYFAALSINRVANNPPTYQVNVTTHQGVQVSVTVGIPI